MLNNLYPLLLQVPTGTPNPGSNSPIDFSSAFDVIVFIVLPILLIAFYLIWRKKQKDEK